MLEYENKKNAFEILIINLNGNNLKVIMVYRPPKSNTNADSALCVTLSRVIQNNDKYYRQF